jgi:hypothetical protein
MPWLAYSEKEACPSLFQRVIMSQFDFNTYSAASIEGRLVPVEEFSAAAYLMTGENTAESIHNRIESTLRGSADPRAAVRHLLQSSDPIPNFASSAPPALTIPAFFTEYLVTRGPRETHALREQCRDVLEEQCQWDQVRIGKAMQEATLERTKEIKALSAFTRIAAIYTQIHALTENVIVDTEKVLVYAVAAPLLARRFPARRSFDDYVKRPAQLVEDFVVLAKCVSESSPHAMAAVYSFITSSFDFERFRVLRPDCARLDELLGQKIARHQATIVAAIFPGAAKPAAGFNEPKFLLETILAIREKNPECLDILRRAFREANPRLKLDEIAFALASMRKYVQANTPPTRELGEDQWLPLTLAFFYLANPPHIVTNYVLIHDFCYPTGYGSLFLALVVQPMSSLKILVEHLGAEFQRGKLFRIKVDDGDA